MKPTQLYLPRSFRAQIGFIDAIRRAGRLPPDPDLLRLFRELAPGADWAAMQGKAEPYQPPRWLGFWQSFGVYWASDGILKIAAPEPVALVDVFDQVHRTHFIDRAVAPFRGQEGREATCMLLHDAEDGRIFVAPFEQAEATLFRQPRTPFF